MAEGVRTPRSRGGLSGLALILLGAWGGIAPYAGPSLGFETAKRELAVGDDAPLDDAATRVGPGASTSNPAPSGAAAAADNPAENAENVVELTCTSSGENALPSGII